MSYPKTGHEVYVSLNLSNTMLTTMGAGTIDSLPHCGAIHGYASITKERVRDVYADVFFNSVICPIIATTISIIAAYLLGFAYV